MQKAIFLDRDGVINYDPGDYTKDVSEFIILPDVLNCLVEFNQLGFQLIIITNQGGIAKGMYGLKDFKEIDEYMHEQFRTEGIVALQTFLCTHHPDFGRCLCRKPLSLMVKKAIAKYHLNAESSFMIGDKQRDIDCAAGAGVNGILIETNTSLLLALDSIKNSLSA
jgi:D-glycero-D-manno-heptose 1,7-bisphosphate phosphatase